MIFTDAEERQQRELMAEVFQVRKPENQTVSAAGEMSPLPSSDIHERVRAFEEANPWKLTEVDYTCACDGCWACEGHAKGCTCDVNWDELAEARDA